MEERKRKAEEKKRVKRMLEAGFDGDLDEINAILKEVILLLFFLTFCTFLMDNVQNTFFYISLVMLCETHVQGEDY